MSASSTNSFASAHSFLSADNEVLSESVNTSGVLSANTTVEFESTLKWQQSVNSCHNMSTTQKKHQGSVNAEHDKQDNHKQQEAEIRANNEKTNKDCVTLIQEINDKNLKGETMTKEGQNNTSEEKDGHKTILKEDGTQDGQKMQNSSQSEHTMHNPSAMSKMDATGYDNVVSMFQKLMEKVNGVSEEIKKLREEKEENSEIIKTVKCEQEKLQSNQASQDQKIAELETENSVVKEKVSMLADAVAYQTQVIDELRNKVDLYERERIKPNLFIHGIPENQGEDCQSLIKDFFENKMKISQEITLRKAHRVGKVKVKPILITLKNPHEKGLIFANVANLQELKKMTNKSTE